jgi:hypothetical protein
MSIQVLAINSRLVLRPTMRVKFKRRLREAVRLIVTRGAAVEESRGGQKLVFRAEDIGADKWIAPGVLLSHTPTFCRYSFSLGGLHECVFFLTMGFTQIGRTLHCRPQRCSVFRLWN